MRIAVLGSPTSWYLRDLQRAASGRHEISSVPFAGLSATTAGRATRVASAGLALSECQAVLVRTMSPGTLEQVVFRMDALARLAAAGTLVINPPKAVEAAVDKCLATALLAAAGLRVPRTHVCQTADDAMRAFADLGRDVVLKPVFGSEGRGITRLQDEALALRAFKMLEQLGAVLYLQEFIEHEGADLRLLVIGERVLAMRRFNPHDWRTNLSRGASAAPFSPAPDLVDMARAAARAVGAPLAGVDLLPGRDGHVYAIEVNASPGWKGLAAALQIDVSKLVLEYLEGQIGG